MLVTGLTTEFFSLGRGVGLLLALVGLGLFVWATFLAKKIKEKEAKAKMGLVKKVILTLAGITLGVVFVIVILAIPATFFGGNLTIKTKVGP